MRRSATMSTSSVARGMPCSEVASEPPTDFSEIRHRLIFLIPNTDFLRPLSPIGTYSVRRQTARTGAARPKGFLEESYAEIALRRGKAVPGENPGQAHDDARLVAAMRGGK